MTAVLDAPRHRTNDDPQSDYRLGYLGRLVDEPRKYPWWPEPDLSFNSGPPPIMPDLATLQRVLEGLRNL